MFPDLALLNRDGSVRIGRGAGPAGPAALVDLVDLAGALPAGRAPGEVVLDLSDLGFLDVAGGRALHAARRDLAGAGIGLRVTGAHRRVRRRLDLVDLVAAPVRAGVRCRGG